MKALKAPNLAFVVQAYDEIIETIKRGDVAYRIFDSCPETIPGVVFGACDVGSEWHKRLCDMYPGAFVSLEDVEAKRATWYQALMTLRGEEYQRWLELGPTINPRVDL